MYERMAFSEYYCFFAEKGYLAKEIGALRSGIPNDWIEDADGRAIRY